MKRKVYLFVVIYGFYKQVVLKEHNDLFDWTISFFFLLNLGDEILVVNGKSLQGLKHDEAINVFKSIKTGDVLILIGRRMPKVRKLPDVNTIAVNES